MEIIPKSNFARDVLVNNNHCINFEINKDLKMLNTQNNIYMNYVLEELHNRN